MPRAPCSSFLLSIHLPGGQHNKGIGLSSSGWAREGYKRLTRSPISKLGFNDNDSSLQIYKVQPCCLAVILEFQGKVMYYFRSKSNLKNKKPLLFLHFLHTSVAKREYIHVSWTVITRTYNLREFYSKNLTNSITYYVYRVYFRNRSF